MPAVAHFLCHYLLGAHTAHAQRNGPFADDGLLSWPLMLGLLWAALLLVPVTTVQTVLYPNYMLAYAFDPELHPAFNAHVELMSLALMLANTAAVVAGYALMRYARQSSSRYYIRLPPTAALLLLAGYLAHEGSRAWLYGDYLQFWQNQAASFSQTPSAWFVPAAYVATLALIPPSARFAQRALRLFGKRIPPSKLKLI